MMMMANGLQLEHQLEEKELARQRDFEEFLKEKLMIDDIVRKINDEDAQEQERAFNQKVCSNAPYLV